MLCGVGQPQTHPGLDIGRYSRDSWSQCPVLEGSKAISGIVKQQRLASADSADASRWCQPGLDIGRLPKWNEIETQCPVLADGEASEGAFSG